jgi:hypothetical protein
LLFFVEDAFVPVDEEVVVDADGFDVGREVFEVDEEVVPSGGGVAARIVLNEGFGCVDVEIPSAPGAAAWVVTVRWGRRVECSPSRRVTRRDILPLHGCG